MQKIIFKVGGIKTQKIFLDNNLLEILLKDRTTGKNILWATSDYNFAADSEIHLQQTNLIKPRHEKNLQHKKNRTRKNAEVFTPTKICKIQIDSLVQTFEKISWQNFITKNILEITCGEAPYIVNRYDAVSGEEIKIKNRCGILDRKLNLISANINAPEDWYFWTRKAVQSVYGYEFQGDNLFLARKNILLTVAEFFAEKFFYDAYKGFLKEIAEIISWNFWQMDGLKNSVPYAKIETNLFDEPQENVFCKIMDWQENKVVTFKNIRS